MDFSPEALRARFDKLTRDSAKIDETLEPLRDELDALMANDKIAVGTRKAREADLRPQIVELQGKKYPIEQERAAVARALKGQTTESVNG